VISNIRCKSFWNNFNCLRSSEQDEFILPLLKLFEKFPEKVITNNFNLILIFQLIMCTENNWNFGLLQITFQTI
jgi:hypothetical protein